MSYLDSQSKTEIRDGMRIDWDVPITVDDGLVLRCDVYRPIEDGKYPVLMTYGPYGKYLLFQTPEGSMLLHLGMSGRIVLQQTFEPREKPPPAIFKFPTNFQANNSKSTPIDR